MSETLRVAVEKRDGYAVLVTEGYINNSGGEQIAQEADGLLREGYRKLLLNLRGTTIVNSIGISILIEVLEKTLDLGGRLAFSNLTPTIEKTFRIMGFTRYADIFPNEEAAVRALLETPDDAAD